MLLLSNVESVVEGVLLIKFKESKYSESAIEESITVASLLVENDVKSELFNSFLLCKNCLLNLIRSFKSKIPAKEFVDTFP